MYQSVAKADTLMRAVSPTDTDHHLSTHPSRSGQDVMHVYQKEGLRRSDHLSFSNSPRG
jgi:hypothetical protein